MNVISYIYADLIETSLKTGTTYKTLDEVPIIIRKEVEELLIKNGINIS